MGRTITLDDDVAERLEAAAAQAQKSVDDLLRDTLPPAKPIVKKPFRVRARNLGVRQGVNFDCAWKLLEEVEGK